MIRQPMQAAIADTFLISRLDLVTSARVFWYVLLSMIGDE